ncbi:hypothetical protein HOY82DRAFT_541364 [Tuber indicum]|nr:hypothetical protein HOY82DRAFT_541364 [Tuber indicum]
MSKTSTGKTSTGTGEPWRRKNWSEKNRYDLGLPVEAKVPEDHLQENKDVEGHCDIVTIPVYRLNLHSSRVIPTPSESNTELCSTASTSGWSRPRLSSLGQIEHQPLVCITIMPASELANHLLGKHRGEWSLNAIVGNHSSYSTLARDTGTCLPHGQAPMNFTSHGSTHQHRYSLRTAATDTQYLRTRVFHRVPSNSSNQAPCSAPIPSILATHLSAKLPPTPALVTCGIAITPHQTLVSIRAHLEQETLQTEHPRKNSHATEIRPTVGNGPDSESHRSPEHPIPRLWADKIEDCRATEKARKLRGRRRCLRKAEREMSISPR